MHPEKLEQWKRTTDFASADIFWKIVPTNTPKVIKNCTKCGKQKPFNCSEKFRINAQQRNLDVWLIYKCEKCDATWNCSILRRISPNSLTPESYRCFLQNDRNTAWQYAFDFELLKRNGVRVEQEVDYFVDGPQPQWEHMGKDNLKIAITFDYMGRWRIDTLLAKRLGVSRKNLHKLFEVGGLTFTPMVQDLSMSLQGFTLLEIRVEDLRALQTTLPNT